MVYVHYGFSVFLPELFVPVRNGQWKPKPDDGTGLWACREGDAHGWREWCRRSGLAVYADDDCFRFTLAPGAKVLELYDPAQLEELPKAKPLPELERLFNLTSDWVMLDYEKLLSDGYDAIELTDWYALRHRLALWDCNCLFVMNPKVIVEVKSGKDNSGLQT
jgi:hypothetical protein